MAYEVRVGSWVFRVGRVVQVAYEVRVGSWCLGWYKVAYEVRVGSWCLGWYKVAYEGSRCLGWYIGMERLMRQNSTKFIQPIAAIYRASRYYNHRYYTSCEV